MKFVTDGKSKFSVTNETAFYVGIFPVVEPSYWLVKFELQFLLVVYFLITNRKVSTTPT